MAATPDRNFVVGESIVVTIRVSKPGTKTPTDATVEFIKVVRSGFEPVAGLPTFTRLAEGLYQATLLTPDWIIGTYDVSARVSSGIEKVSIVTDRFVLYPAP